MSKNTPPMLQLKIQLRNITKPPVWRRVLIPSDITFHELHYIIQAAFGWYNEHLFKFQHRPYDREWTVEVSESDEDFSGLKDMYGWGILRRGPEQMEARTTKVGDLLKAKHLQKFVYIYDFGDDWVHDITIENTSSNQVLQYPRCIDGKGACPPEDCGGPWGYQAMKDSGEASAPMSFNLGEADASVRHYLNQMVAHEEIWGKGYDGQGNTDEADDYEEDDFDETDDDMEDDTDFDENTYTYQHPDYPKTLEMENPWVGEELCKRENALSLKPELVKRILALPADSLRQDLEHLIMYHVGLTCDEITDDYDPGDRFNGVIGLSLILLAEVGNGESSLDVVLKVMRQSPEFSEYHICDAGEDLLIPTICKLGQEHLDKLIAYAEEPGLYGYLQCQAFAAMRVMAFYNPDLRQPVVEGFRELLRYYADYSQSHDVDRELLGLLVSEVTDLHAPELLPEVKALFDAGVVNEATSGDYKSVARDIRKRRFENPVKYYSFTAEARFKELYEFYKE
jgi:hypothetical protein